MTSASSSLLLLLWAPTAHGQTWQDAADATTGATGGLGSSAPSWTGWDTPTSGVDLPDTCAQAVRLRGAQRSMYVRVHASMCICMLFSCTHTHAHAVLRYVCVCPHTGIGTQNYICSSGAWVLVRAALTLHCHPAPTSRVLSVIALLTVRTVCNASPLRYRPGD